MPISLRCLLQGLALTLLVSPTLALAALPSLKPFAAEYQLGIDGWPDARVAHRLSRQGEHWQSDMQAAVALAKGSERSRFRIEEDTIRATAYSSRYSLLGIGGSYRLGHQELAPILDRQAALIALSRQANTASCTATAPPCELTYQDHKGREETLHYRVGERAPVTLPAGDFEAIRVETWEPDEPERLLTFRFHPDYPGLLLSVDYRRDGELTSQLRLIAFSP
ncbi:hypothetical protein [Litchfieldella xinjiangensis]|uniref:hypothetical protein n=1 Tax=Litchfieldella xinjiangensis TaxID=1166948 RepID=UPI0005B9B10F|nr:hypothetical protein [Halomonas xinjiangensis]